MNSNIPAKFYYDTNVYEGEKNPIFFNNWIFVGFKDDFKSNNDFVTHTIGNLPIVVQNLRGEVKAFLNVCSHRFSIIQKELRGCRPLMCPYHGWTYDKDGIPTGIPKKPLFKDFTREELCDLKLKEYTVDNCGNLFFVSINSPTITLKEYLGSFYSELERMSSSLGELCDINAMTINANWKVIVENTLESYHVNLIHAETFRKLGASGLVFNFTNTHSNWVADLAVGENDAKLKKLHAPFATRTYKINGYVHYLVFPNLLISSSYGTSFNISLVNPVNEKMTDFTSYVYLSKTDGSASQLVKVYKDSLVEFNRTVFKEDKDICEEVQKGVSHTQQKGVLSLEEERVQFFQKEYIKQVSK